MSRRDKIVRGTSAVSVPAHGISRHAIFAEQRDTRRAEVCSCGHERVFHQDDCARCIRYGCDCLSFSIHQYQEVSL